MRRWLATLSYSFVIGAAVLCWQIYRALEGQMGVVPAWQLILWIIGAACSLAVGVAGLVQRHRRL
jgi:hypothetical protein